MSKVKTPTDNQIIEALNAWMKDELSLTLICLMPKIYQKNN